MPDENEHSALAKIKGYLDSGHSLEEVRGAGWGSWIEHLEAKGYDLRTGRLAPSPPDVSPSSQPPPNEPAVWMARFRASRRWQVGVALLIGAVVAGTAIGVIFGVDFSGDESKNESPEVLEVLESTRTLTGSLTLTKGTWEVGERCVGDDGYSDIRQGAQVVIRGPDGTIVATGRLRNGEAISVSIAGLSLAPDCEFPFSVASVPDEDFYSIEVSHRGEITYSRDDLEALNWELDLSLGD